MVAHLTLIHTAVPGSNAIPSLTLQKLRTKDNMWIFSGNTCEELNLNLEVYSAEKFAIFHMGDPPPGIEYLFFYTVESFVGNDFS
jgi:hypothetical protein